MAELNIRQLHALAAADNEDDYYSQPVWVQVDHADGSYDLYTVTGFSQNQCQPTLAMEFVQHMPAV